MSDAVGQALVMALVLGLPIAALVSRRLPGGTLIRYVIAWIAIFVLGLVAVSYFT